MHILNSFSTELGNEEDNETKIGNITIALVVLNHVPLQMRNQKIGLDTQLFLQTAMDLLVQNFQQHSPSK